MYPSEITRERVADGVIHISGLLAVLTGCLALVIYAVAKFDAPLIIACSIYAICMIASFGASASYHLLPQHHWRSGLRRFDHAAIYALIAGTFTPLLVHIGTTLLYFVLGAVWTLAIPAMLFKVLGENIEPRWSLASYMGLGWIGSVAMPDFWSTLPTPALVAIIAGAFFYSFGTIFYGRKTQAYRYAVWHLFVLLGTAAFFIAIWFALFPA
ncbi:MAG: hemolysin III family protein [Parasphingorhabdus sp.]|uniref:PAQR family membrane homeostasis protein TrhA n=1 Tax=Parasphingorhabdus sp. TaxID=2709688 RepID=UPI003299EAA8